MKSKSSLARGALALSIAGILSKVISVLYTPMLRSILGESGYGVYCQVLEVFLFVYALTTVGAQPAVAKVVAEFNALKNKNSNSKIFSISIKLYLVIGLMGSLLLAALSFPISSLLGGNILYGILALSPCVLITCILSTVRGFMQGNSNMKAIAISQVIEQFINVFVSLICAYLLLKSSGDISLGVAGAQVGTSVGALIAVLFIVFTYAKSKARNKAEAENDYNMDESDYDTKYNSKYNSENNSEGDSKYNSKYDSEDNYEDDSDSEMLDNSAIRKKILFYSVPIIISAGLQNLGGIIDMINVKTRLLSIGLPSESANILYGNYGLYKTLIGVPMVIITSIATSLLPSICKSHALRDRKKIRVQVKLSYKLTLLIAIPAAVGLGVVADSIYYSLFGSTNGSLIMKVGSFILILMAVTQLQVSILQGVNKLYFILFTYGIGILFKIILNYIFVGIKDINIYGVLIGNCFWYLIPAILNHKMIKRISSRKLRISKLITRPLLCSFFMAAAIIIVNIPLSLVFANPGRFTSILMLIIEIPIGVFVYIYTLIIFKGIRRKDIELISPKLIKLLPSFMSSKLH